MQLSGLALAVNLALALLGVRAGALDGTGALAGLVCGLGAWNAFGFPGFALIGVFAMAGHAATRFGYATKARRGLAQNRGGRRTWVNVAANCAAPTVCAVFEVLPNTGSLPPSTAFIAAIACALGDTVATELGQTRDRPCVILPTFRRVPTGTPGGVSGFGTACGLAAIVVLAGLGTQWLGLPAGTVLPISLAAAGGFFLESVLQQFDFIRRPGGWLPNLLATFLAAGLGSLGG